MQRRMGLQQGILKPLGRSVPLGNKGGNININMSTIKNLAQTQSPRVCIYRSLGGIGDVLMSTPALRAIKDEWPNSYIVYATDFNYMNGALREILSNNPFIDEIASYQSCNPKHFDVYVDITSSCVMREQPKAKVPNRIDMFAESIGVSLTKTGYTPVYVVKDEEKEWARKKFQRLNKYHKDFLIGVQASSSSKARTWPEEKIKDLIPMLSNHPKFKVIVFDKIRPGQDENKWNFVNVSPIVNYNIRHVAALVNELDLIITPDSGLMHLAGALGVPNLAIFGPTDPDARVNHYPNSEAIYRQVACFPCWYDATACKGAMTCINNISVNEVYNKAVSMVLGPDNKVDQPRTPIIEARKDTDYCIIRDDGIGDLMACLPAFSTFRKSHKDQKIVLATLEKNRELMQLSGCFDEIVCLSKKWTPIRQGKKILDARDLFEKNQIQNHHGCYYEEVSRLEAMAKFLGVSPDETYKFPKSDKYENLAKEMLEKYGLIYGEDKFVAIQLKATCSTRSWEKSYYRDLPRELHKEGYIPVVLNNTLDNTFNIYPCINLTGKTDIALFNSIIALSDMFIGVDSGGAHLAAANRIPFIVLCNAIDPELRFGSYRNYRAIYTSSLHCCPCWDRGCPAKTCMKLVTSDVIIDAVKDLVTNLGEKIIHL